MVDVAASPKRTGEAAHGGWRVLAVIGGLTKDVGICHGHGVDGTPEDVAHPPAVIWENIRRSNPNSGLVRCI